MIGFETFTPDSMRSTACSIEHYCLVVSCPVIVRKNIFEKFFNILNFTPVVIKLLLSDIHFTATGVSK